MLKKLKISNLIISFIIWYEVATAFLALFLPNAENKLYIIFLINIIAYCNYFFLIKKRCLFMVANTLTITYILYCFYDNNLYYVIHLDFYCYIGLAYILLLCCSHSFRKDFREYVDGHINSIAVMSICFLVIVFLSIPLKNGLHRGFNMSMPLLYGPYAIPHNIAYEMLFLYCLVAYCYRKSSKKVFLIQKAIFAICIAWTGTRSAFVALAVVMMLEYFMMKSAKKKTAFLLCGVLILVYLGLFTDVLINNPITQKTLAALRDTDTISNSRNRFTQVSLRAWLGDESIIHKIMGYGIDNVREALRLEPTIGVAIHAHNDFVNILCGYGIIGFFALIWLLIAMARPFWRKKHTILLLLMDLVLVILIYTNGLGMYCCATPCIPMLMLLADNPTIKKERI